MEKVSLRKGHEISRVIRGNWQLAGGHGEVSARQAIEDMFASAEAGITTFDFADIYTGVEEIIGNFLRAYGNKHGEGAKKTLKMHDKFVPDYADLAKIDMQYVERIIDRSLKRLETNHLDLVQFHWWEYAVPRYLDTIHYLKALQKKGKIRNIGVTNFDTVRLKEIVESGVDVVSAQVQYSLLDQRPEKSLAQYVALKDVKLLCYGSLAGGFLSERYLGVPEPKEPLENRSLIKYKLIINEFGGWDIFQELLRTAKKIADKHRVTISAVAMRYVLDKLSVAAVIVGARNSQHLKQTLRVSSFKLDAGDYAALQKVLGEASAIPGEVYEIERDKTGPHGSIMKYNLSDNEKK